LRKTEITEGEGTGSYMRNQMIYIVFILFLWMGVSSCSNIKYLKKGEKLYVGGSVKLNADSLKKSERKSLEEELEGLLRPKPNSSILGLRPKLFIYNIAGTPKKDKGFKYWLKNKVGEPPVLTSKLDLDYNASVLQNRLENKGYFRANTEADSTEKRRRVKAYYVANVGVQYRIREVVFPDGDNELDSAIRETQRNTFLKAGEPYDLDKIKAERERIDARLKEKGFYYFGPDYILAKVDSNVAVHQVDVFIEVKDSTPEKFKEVYTIDSIYIYPNYSLYRNRNLKRDTPTTYKDFNIIDPRKTFKPQIFDRTMFFSHGDVYNRTDHNLSLNRLVNLGVFKFVKNQFVISDSLQNTLNTYYYLTPLKKKSIRVEVLGKTNSANYRGTELNVNWSNRNTFRGAELLTISAFGGFEVQVGGQNKGYNVYRFGTEANLFWPRFITPFTINSSSAFVPKTKATLGYEYQRRMNLYTLNSFKGSFGYIWKEDIRKEHQLNVIDAIYVNSTNVTQEYVNRIDTIPSLARVIERQLIFGPTYSFTFTNTTAAEKKHGFYYKGGLDLSAIITGLVTGANASKGDTSMLFGVPFSQYIKMEHDFRYYLKLSNRNKWANRLFIGAGLPFGNSRELPYIKQFFSGGTNSIRAFRARSIGPGSYLPVNDAESFTPDQSGDIKLELNTEYRSKLFSIVEGAIFIDAGNIWIKNKDVNRPVAEISKDFLNDLAVGAGAGIRLDLSFLILRGDLAFPIRKPYLPKNERWVIDDINLGSKQWRKENLVFNLAIGYPF
jgi:outer membrane protein insertion porin family